MIPLKDYVDCQAYALPKGPHRTFEEFLDINSLDEQTVSEKTIKFYYAHNWSKFLERSHESEMFWINETLTSHPHDKLINKIKKELANKFNDVYCISNKDAKALPVVMNVGRINSFVTNFNVGSNRLSKTKASEKLYDILEFFNYYVSTIELADDKNSYDIYFEPEFTKDISEQIKKNGGHLYHVTSEEAYYKSIKKTGLRPRVGKTEKENGYRYFVERVFLIGDNETKEQTIENIKDVIKDKQAKDYVILDIDINDHSIGLWEDGASEGKYNVYTYEAIPPYLIKRVLKNVEDI